MRSVLSAMLPFAAFTFIHKLVAVDPIVKHAIEAWLGKVGAPGTGKVIRTVRHRDTIGSVKMNRIFRLAIYSTTGRPMLF